MLSNALNKKDFLIAFDIAKNQKITNNFQNRHTEYFRIYVLNLNLRSQEIYKSEIQANGLKLENKNSRIQVRFSFSKYRQNPMFKFQCFGFLFDWEHFNLYNAQILVALGGFNNQRAFSIFFELKSTLSFTVFQRAQY
eukprot:TRINITY_DN86190_c0_g1_i1.p1 TRINITY_DN86190_c0_g1~~TRINITY_DN86190_c0_g1_i1.p1  ORF type:complete len:138 (-),score=1.36 TRINITY_DN86190_c0_g1_i1:212-625(-)